MFDCGENTQRQMMQAKVSFHKKLNVFLTHLHGDHVLGLPGVLQTMALMDRKEPVQIYGPKGIKDFLGLHQRNPQFRLNVLQWKSTKSSPKAQFSTKKNTA